MPQLMASTPSDPWSAPRELAEAPLPEPVLKMVAKAVAVLPTLTDTTLGSTDALRVGGGGQPTSACMAKLNTPLSVPAWIHEPDEVRASALTLRSRSPALSGLQLAPPSVLLKIPPPNVPA